MRFAVIDIFLFGGICLALYRGYRGGVTKKLFNLLALIGSIVLATKLMYPVGSKLISIFLLSALWGYLLAFVLTVGTVMLATMLIYRQFEGNTIANKASQFFGVVIGLIEGLIVMSLLLLMLKLFDVPASETRKESLLYKPVVTFVPKMFDLLKSYLPGADSFRKDLSKAFEEYDIFDRASDAGKGL